MRRAFHPAASLCSLLTALLMAACGPVATEVPADVTACRDLDCGAGDCMEAQELRFGGGWEPAICSCPDGDQGSSCPRGYLRAFVTSQTYSPDFASHVGEDLLPVQAADRICQLAAEGAVWEGRFVAWLSSENSDAIDRVAGTGPWAVEQTSAEDAVTVFNNASALLSAPLEAIERDERGEIVSRTGRAWTGTNSAGRVAAEGACQGWTSTGSLQRGTVGNPASESDWTDEGTQPCSAAHHLYCFEIEAAVED